MSASVTQRLLRPQKAVIEGTWVKVTIRNPAFLHAIPRSPVEPAGSLSHSRQISRPGSSENHVSLTSLDVKAISIDNCSSGAITFADVGTSPNRRASNLANTYLRTRLSPVRQTLRHLVRPWLGQVQKGTFNKRCELEMICITISVESRRYEYASTEP